MGNAIRCFVAVLLPEDTMAAIGAVQRELQPLAPDLKWVRPELIHATIKFLGSVDEEALPGVKAALERASRTDAFSVRLGELGAFPDAHRPRVVWVGMHAPQGAGAGGGDQEGCPQLVSLARRVDEESAAQGMAREVRPFVPHLTLARSRARGGQRVPPELAARLARPGPIALGEFPVDAIHLMRSDLRPEGPIYTPLARMPLHTG